MLDPFLYGILSMIANGPISSFIPIIINSFGFSTLNSLLLMMPLGAVTGTIEWGSIHSISASGNSHLDYVYFSMGTTMSSLLLLLLPLSATGGLLFGVYFLASLGGMYSILMGLQMTNTAGKSLDS